MDSKVLNFLRFSLRLWRTWSVIREHLFASQQNSSFKNPYTFNLREMDCNVLSLSMPLQRFWRLSSAILPHLREGQKFIFQKSLTHKSRDRWILKYFVFWDFHWGCEDLDLWFHNNYKQVNQLIFKKSLTFENKERWIVKNWAFQFLY